MTDDLVTGLDDAPKFWECHCSSFEGQAKFLADAFAL
jgi:hypothetical protein